jgi:two-component system nitrate/nitrite response regulator NarL
LAVKKNKPMNLKKPQIRLVIAADHPIFRDGLRRLLEAEPNHKVIGEASDGAEGVRLTRQLKPDILLLDLAMPKHPGLEALRELNTPGNATTVRVILLTVPIEKGQIVEVLQLRAQGIVLKDAPTQVLLKAIQTVMAGGYWLDPEIMHSKHDEAPQRKFGLTPRELEILWDVYDGHSNQEIAEHFGISEDAVKHHLRNILNKSGVASGLEIFIERSSFWRAVRRMTEAIDPVHGIYTVFAISVLMFVLFVVATVKYGRWR